MKKNLIGLLPLLLLLSVGVFVCRTSNLPVRHLPVAFSFILIAPGRTTRLVITEHTATSLRYEWDTVQNATMYRIIVRNASNYVVANEVSF